MGGFLTCIRNPLKEEEQIRDSVKLGQYEEIDFNDTILKNRKTKKNTTNNDVTATKRPKNMKISDSNTYENVPTASSLSNTDSDNENLEGMTIRHVNGDVIHEFQNVLYASNPDDVIRKSSIHHNQCQTIAHEARDATYENCNVVSHEQSRSSAIEIQDGAQTSTNQNTGNGVQPTKKDDEMPEVLKDKKQKENKTKHRHSKDPFAKPLKAPKPKKSPEAAHKSPPPTPDHQQLTYVELDFTAPADSPKKKGDNKPPTSITYTDVVNDGGRLVLMENNLYVSS